MCFGFNEFYIAAGYKQNVIKKRWLLDFNKELQDLYVKRLKNEI